MTSELHPRLTFSTSQPCGLGQVPEPLKASILSSQNAGRLIPASQTREDPWPWASEPLVWHLAHSRCSCNFPTARVREAPGSQLLQVLLPCYSLGDLFFFTNYPRHHHANPSPTSCLICALGKLLSLGTRPSIYKVVVIIITLQKVKIKRYFIPTYYM